MHKTMPMIVYGSLDARTHRQDVLQFPVSNDIMAAVLRPSH
jgi:hypothetical protein